MPASEPAYPSVWVRPPRQPRSSLTREQIVAEALRILDAEGAEALSMRKLAAGLGSGATSLYWHVANRDELIELVIDKVYGELELPDAEHAAGTDDWREITREFARGTRSIALRHTWVVSVLDHFAAAGLGPNVAQATERMLAVFERAGFELAEAERALNTVGAYITGVAMSEAAWHNWLARRDLTQQEWIDNALRLAEEATEDHQRLRSVVTSYEGKNPQQAMNDDFEYGLECVLDGLQARLDRRS
jgi:AcrR family transcriptional regulator